MPNVNELQGSPSVTQVLKSRQTRSTPLKEEDKARGLEVSRMTSQGRKYTSQIEDIGPRSRLVATPVQ